MILMPIPCMELWNSCRNVFESTGVPIGSLPDSAPKERPKRKCVAVSRNWSNIQLYHCRSKNRMLLTSVYNSGCKSIVDPSFGILLRKQSVEVSKKERSEILDL